MSSFGDDLKRERELRQITLREISEVTKISMRYLDALERNDFKHLPGGVFNKGFVRAYAQFIGVDPEAMVNAYLLEEKEQQVRAKPVKGPGAHAAKARAGRPAAATEGSRARRVLLLVWLAVVVLVGAVAVWLWTIRTEIGS